MKRLLGQTFAAALLSVTFAGYASAQDGTIHGGWITAKSGGGCVNTSDGSPLVNPFQDPGFPNAIRCTEDYTSSLTYQGDATGLNKKQYSDNLGNFYTELASDGSISYCGGSSCYAAAPNDGAYRTSGTSVSQHNVVKAVNGKNDPSENVALRISSLTVIDGKGIGFSLEGGNAVLELGQNEVKTFEIFPYSPDFNSEAELANPLENPYTISWVQPDKTTSPHKAIQQGIGFISGFDGSRWRYYLAVNGELLPSIGKYLVQFSITKNKAVPVAFRYKNHEDSVRFCGASGVCQRNDLRMSLIATVTVSYGTEQCIKKAGIGLPSIIPLLDVHKSMLDSMSKDYKPAFRKLNSLLGKFGRLVTVRLRARTLKRSIALAYNYNAESRAFEEAKLQSLTELYTEQELGSFSEDLLNRGQNVILGDKKNRISVRRLSKNFMKVLGSFLSNNKPGQGQRAGTAAERKKAAEYKKFVTNADIEYNKYSDAMVAALQKDSELRRNSFQCGAVF